MKKNALLFLIMISLFLTFVGCNNADAEEITEEEGTIYTNEEIYIVSFDCACNSIYEPLRNHNCVIETEEQLELATEFFYLDRPINEEYAEWYPVDVWTEFLKMKDMYSLENYNYLLAYQQVSGDYDLKADKVKITENGIAFLMSDDSVYPEDGEPQPCIELGFFHMAAVPKEYCAGYEWENIIYPDVNDVRMYQEYKLRVNYDMADESLYEVYGDNKYLIRSEEEYEAFLAMAEDVKLYENNTNYFWDYQDDNAVLVTYFTTDQTNEYCRKEDVVIDGNTISMEYEIIKKGTGEKTDTNTCRLYAYVPLELITEEEYEGWIIPQ